MTKPKQTTTKSTTTDSSNQPKRKHTLTSRRPKVPANAETYGELSRAMNRLVSYSHQRLIKFSKVEKNQGGYVPLISSDLHNCMLLTEAVVAYDSSVDREATLRQMSRYFKVIERLVQASYNDRQINERSRDAWLRYLVSIDDMTIALAMSEQRRKNEQKDDK